jgi:ArsR family transcriptional regulator, arsenate/arsenite/antimonite-responsive transcriptional repressor
MSSGVGGAAAGRTGTNPLNSQPTVSHHLKVLREAGVVGSERPGLWAYYYVIPDALKELSTWLEH